MLEKKKVVDLVLLLLGCTATAVLHHRAADSWSTSLGQTKKMRPFKFWRIQRINLRLTFTHSGQVRYQVLALARRMSCACARIPGHQQMEHTSSLLSPKLPRSTHCPQVCVPIKTIKDQGKLVFPDTAQGSDLY